jgi:S-(hydroxymethyl)glutathione dehydrogenase/alcohol dehydrogenase
MLCATRTSTLLMATTRKACFHGAHPDPTLAEHSADLATHTWHSILGHEAGGIVESVGEGVTSVVVGDHVVPGYTPQCCQPTCIFCQSPKTNLCPQIRSTQGQGVMPDGTSRFTNAAGETIFHFMGCSTMSEYTVLAEISCAKVMPSAPLEKIW